MTKEELGHMLCPLNTIYTEAAREAAAKEAAAKEAAKDSTKDPNRHNFLVCSLIGNILCMRLIDYCNDCVIATIL